MPSQTLRLRARQDNAQGISILDNSSRKVKRNFGSGTVCEDHMTLFILKNLRESREHPWRQKMLAAGHAAAQRPSSRSLSRVAAKVPCPEHLDAEKARGEIE